MMKAYIQTAELTLFLCVAFVCSAPKASAQTPLPSYEPDEVPAQLHPQTPPFNNEIITFEARLKNEEAQQLKKKKTKRSSKRLYFPRALAYVPIDSSVCAQLDSACLTFPGGNARIMPAYSKLSRILQGVNERLNIIHIGDSHIQADIISGRIRHNLTNMAPGCSSDRGILFPFHAIGTNGPSDYSIAYTGRWTKNWNIEREPFYPIGATGAVALTSDASASLSIDVKQGKWAFSALRILGSSSTGLCTPVVEVDGQKFSATTDDQPGYIFEFPAEATRCTIAFSGSGTFALRGIIPISNRPGITYSAIGINGASCLSWMRCEKLEEELRLLHPDIAVVALGTNDANASTIDIENFKSNYRRLLDRIISASPNCFIIFTTNPDCYIGTTQTWCPTTPQTQRAFYELAREYHAAVFDIFAIQGGSHSTDRWVATGLQQQDHVHFTTKGYTLLGDLFFNALLRSYKEARSSSTPETLKK